MKEWPENWLYIKQENQTLVETGLNWMLTLWAYRDPEVNIVSFNFLFFLLYHY